jgi:WD repeat-containing protein 35
VDTFIYFANIRPDYKWGFFSNTLCYAFSTPERTEHCVVFWDTKTDDRYVKYVKNLLFIRAAGENCVLVTKTSDGSSDKYILILCNAIGSPVDSKYIAVDPKFVTMTQYHVVVASEEIAYVWQYRTPVSKLTSLDQGTHSLRREGGSRERMFHIDDQGINEGDTIGKKMNDFDHHNIRPTNDAMCCIASNTKYLLIGRESGTIHRYTLPHISLEGKYVVRCRPQMIGINCNASRMSIIDINSILTFFDFDADSSMDSKGGSLDIGGIKKSGFGSPNSFGRKGRQLDFERKDAWDMVWAEDNPDLFAMMEKTRMYIYRGTEPEEPVLSSGYLCQFNNLSIKAIMLDEIMAAPKDPNKNMVIDFECKSLRDVRHLLEIGLDDAGQFIEENPRTFVHMFEYV